MADIVHLHANDNICVATKPLAAGCEIPCNGRALSVQRAIPQGHKMAVTAIAKDEPVRKYGQIIGFATEAIPAGEWVHSHNLAIGEFVRDYASATETPLPPPPIQGRTFQGFRRANGLAGTRNYIAVLSSVNCSSSAAKWAARYFDESRLQPYPNVHGVVALTHGSGCGMPLEGTTHQMLNRVMGGMARHPNIAAYVLVGLGCEQASLQYLIHDQHLVHLGKTSKGAAPPPVFNLQDCGGTTKTVEAVVRKIAELLPQANDVQREPIPASEIILGTECGGSDGSSGITANPAVGVASDLIVACGGTAILGETTEIFGAEHLLTRRAQSVEVAEKLLNRIHWWQWYARTLGAELDNNPSLGNKQGGLTTIAEKSLGAIAKGGSTALMGVYEYAQPVTAKGFVVMDTPGFDPPSVTGMVAGGANVVVFTTGRGSCFGCKPTPSIKITTNTAIYEKMPDDMDINAGTILEGRSIQEVGHEIFEEILAVASGKPTKSERLGIGDEEFVPWLIGPTL